MKCPRCGKFADKVVDSRPAGERIAIRRRRECLSCGDRFTTYESTEDQILPILIRKNAPTETKVNNIKASITFLSRSLKDLREGAEALIENVDRFEKARAKVVRKSKRRTPAKVRAKKKARVKKPPARKARRLTDTAQVLKIIKRHKRGVDLKKLRDRTGFQDNKIRDIVSRACKTGKIKRVDRGVYTGA